jgi:HYDIN/CFA65/VesB-like, Ig-like domain
MKLLSKWLIMAALVAGYGCKKTSEDTVKPVDSLKNISSANTSVGTQTAVPTLTVTLTSAKALTNGQGFVHRIVVKSGNVVLPNALIGVEDPVLGYCTEVKTNAQGVLDYVSKVPSFLNPGFYMFRFVLIGGNSLTSTVSVYKNTILNYLRHANMVLNISSPESISQAQLVLGIRAQNFAKYDLSTATYLVNSLGQDILNDAMSNQVTKSVLTVSGVGCATPPTAEIACPVFFTTLTDAITVSTAKVITRRVIAQIPMSTALRTNLNNVIDIGAVAYSVNMFKLDQGLITFSDAAAVTWDLNNVQQSLISDGNTFKSLVLAGTVKSGPNEGQMCMLILKSNPTDTPTEQLIVKNGTNTSFNNVATNTSKSITLPLVNLGATPVTVTGIRVNPPFSVSQQTVTVPANSSKDVILTFTPAARGDFQSTITISSNAANPIVTYATDGTGI